MKSNKNPARAQNEPEAPGRRRMLQKLGLFATAAYVAPALLELDTAHAWGRVTRQSPPSRMSPPSRPSRPRRGY